MVATALRETAGAEWSGRRSVERWCYVVGALLIGAGLFHLAVFFVAGGPWFGPVSWRKPFSFGVGFGLTLLAVTWVAPMLRLRETTRAALLAVLALDSIVEVAGIAIQAWRHTPSHFNMMSSFDSTVAMTLAVGGGVLIAVLVRLAVASFRYRPQASDSLALGLRAGFVSLIIGLASGAAMIARGVTLTRTGHQQAAFHEGGFLIPVHGIALTGIVALPLFAWLLGLVDWPEERRLRTVRSVTACYGALIAGALVVCLVRM